MKQFTDKHFVVPLIENDACPISLSVDALLDKIQRVVTSTRAENSELANYRLHDVSLTVADGELKAVLDFRR